MQQFFGQMELFYTEVDRFVKQGFTVVLAVSSEKLRSEFQKLDLELQMVSTDEIQKGKINLLNLSLNNGFNFIDEKLVVVTESEIFGKARKKKTRRLNITNAERLKDYNELEVGDYVVHKNHGIGKSNDKLRYVKQTGLVDLKLLDGFYEKAERMLKEYTGIIKEII